VIQIARDNTGDRSITSGDVVRRVGDGLGCHGYDRCCMIGDLLRSQKWKVMKASRQWILR